MINEQQAMHMMQFIMCFAYSAGSDKTKSHECKNR